jgi:meiotic recombination protein SPO11
LLFQLGWYCGRIEISRPSNDKFTNLNGSTQSVQGLPITKEWIYKASQILNYKKDHPGEKLPTENSHSVFPYDFEIKSDACCIMVVEKEGIYLRLSEDRFFDRVPCIIVTGKGFPDVATRAMVYVLHHTLSIPVFGVCDCNPFGVAVLQTYQQGGSNGRKEATDREIYDIPIYWLGLRPSHVEQVKGELPPEVYQELTDLDKRKIEKLCCQGSSFRNVKDGEKRVEELIAMRANGYKVELESLHWLGWQYMCDWLEAVITEYSEANKEDR